MIGSEMTQLPRQGTRSRHGSGSSATYRHPRSTEGRTRKTPRSDAPGVPLPPTTGGGRSPTRIFHSGRAAPAWEPVTLPVAPATACGLSQHRHTRPVCSARRVNPAEGVIAPDHPQVGNCTRSSSLSEVLPLTAGHTVSDPVVASALAVVAGEKLNGLPLVLAPENEQAIPLRSEPAGNVHCQLAGSLAARF